MKKICLLTLFLLISNQSFSQKSWNLVYKFTENLVGTVSFKDSLDGFATSLTSARVVFKTTDGGLSWKKVAIGAIESSIFKFVHLNNVSIGIGGYRTLIKTTDNGETWILKDYSFVDICSTDNDILFAVTRDGKLYKSIDQGENWHLLQTQSAYCIAVGFFNNLEGICATNSESIIYTTDGGNSWTTVSVPASFVDMKIISETSAIGIKDSRIFRTTDKGKSWSLVKYIGNYINVDKIENAGNGTILVSGGKILLKSTDYAASWGIQSFQGSISSISCINQDIFYLISDYTLYKTINGALTAPGLVSPANKAANITLTVNFEWQSGSVASSFNLQCALDSNFINVVVDTVISNKFLITKKLELNQKYYWRVKDIITNKGTPWSEVYRFTTTNGKPVLVSPANETIDVRIPVTFKYNDISEYPDFYHIQISTESNFLNIAYDSSGVKADSIVISGLFDSTLYNWRVRIKAGTQYSPWSDISSFTTLAKTPRLQKPSNFSELSNNNITFSWSEADSASNYRIQISSDSTFNYVEIDSSNINSTSINLTFKSSLRYFWRVGSQKKDGNVYWSDIWSFKINGLIEFPLDLGTKWYYQASHNYYSINVYTGKDSTDEKKFGITKEVIEIRNDGVRVIENTNYYDDTITKSKEYYAYRDGRFYISSNPVINYESNWNFNNALIKDTCWLYLLCYKRLPYEIFGLKDTAQVYMRESGGKYPFFFHDICFPGIGLVWKDYYSSPNKDTTRLIGLLKNGILYGDTLFSTVGVYEDKSLPINYGLSQNYPNPFNPTTTIVYSIPSLSSVSLKVYDILGREVATLVNEEKPAGRYEVKFNGSSLSSGVYFYRMEAGSYLISKKLLLLK